ncbi:alanine--tRNA ligase [bacterium]|nr:alanine--tRNA ligase [bacterium]
MTSREIRSKFLNFFEKNKHQIVPSSSLIPADTTVLFTSAGMQQFIPYFLGDTVPPFKRAASAQKCFRTSDIEGVGDEFHHTFFEMLGNWSFGDYFKEGAIVLALELLRKVFSIPLDRLYITVFKGEKDIPRDEQAARLWKKYSIPDSHIFWFGKKENFWGPIASSGPCGPCSEIYYDRGKEWEIRPHTLKTCGPNCGCGRFVEIWNLVFMEYNQLESGKLEKLKKHNIDTGAGLERLTCILNNLSSDYQTDLFLPIMDKIKLFAKKSNLNYQRIIADHIRASVFLIADGVLPGKEERSYVLRRLIRRSIRYANLLGMQGKNLLDLAKVVIDNYKDIYPELHSHQADILTVLENEEEKFSVSLKQGLKKFWQVANKTKNKGLKFMDSKDVFHLYDTYGIPFEIIEQMAKEAGLKVSYQDFKKEFSRHQSVSKKGAEKKFQGLKYWGEKVAHLHTATHLLQAALRKVLGEEVRQAGSDINIERLRFDFTFPRKLTQEELEKVEKLVQEKIKEDLPVTEEQMTYEEAIKLGALAFFKERYPKIVKVYTIGDPKNPFSREICAGPHVKRTGQIEDFKIVKQESVGAGVKRIKATAKKKE